MKSLAAIILCWCVLIAQSHAFTVVDDSKKVLEFDRPVKRIVTLAPYLTELLYSIDAADKIIATVDFSDYPVAAKAIPRVGNYENINIEKVIALKPDLVLAWQSANHPQQLRKLEQFGIRIYRSEPRELDDIAMTLRRLGQITGKLDVAEHKASAFLAELNSLRRDYARREVISAFYQVWHEPIYTINGEHIISKVMQLCGIENVFADLSVLAPVIPLEAVLKKDPQMIIASGMAQAEPEWLHKWQDWPSLAAVKSANLFFIPPDLIQRHSLRMLEAAKLMCEQGDVARKNLKKWGQTH